MVKYKNSKDKLKCGVIRKFKMISPANPVFSKIIFYFISQFNRIYIFWDFRFNFHNHSNPNRIYKTFKSWENRGNRKRNTSNKNTKRKDK